MTGAAPIPCASCGEPTPVLVVITGRGGESGVCKRCVYPPAAMLTAKQVKQTAKAAASGQTSMPGGRKP